MDKQQTLALLNHPDVETRLANLARLLAEEAAPPAPTPEQESAAMLKEIRDLLAEIKEQKK